MIKTLVFDFGDVFINLDKEGAHKNALEAFGLDELPEDFIAINTLYEQGFIPTYEFLEFYEGNFPELSRKDIKSIWNYIILDFPKHRLEWLQELKASKKYQLILLSNTNELHIDFIKENISFYNEFKDCFDKFYLSHEINMRKPDNTIYEFVLEDNNLKAKECVFIDDTTENTESAFDLGFGTWNIDPKTQDVVNLFKLKPHLF
ncbi:HAD-IA family hydrolase [Aurantibacter sp.]|uniref:HAD-IA family hydrolase n=1 Tax=Aurantibacter sp. TaxID=2807103 RepID=UPI0035C81D5C